VAVREETATGRRQKISVEQGVGQLYDWLNENVARPRRSTSKPARRNPQIRSIDKTAIDTPAASPAESTIEQLVRRAKEGE